MIRTYRETIFVHPCPCENATDAPFTVQCDLSFRYRSKNSLKIYDYRRYVCHERKPFTSAQPIGFGLAQLSRKPTSSLQIRWAGGEWRGWEGVTVDSNVDKLFFKTAGSCAGHVSLSTVTIMHFLVEVFTQRGASHIHVCLLFCCCCCLRVLCERMSHSRFD